MKKYYSVTAKCGHVGKRFYIPMTFAIRADSAKEAARIVRGMPRVKHNHKDAIQSVQEITMEEYYDLRQKNDSDPYLHCKCIQDQRKTVAGIYDRLIEEDLDSNGILEKSTSRTVFFAGKEPVRNIKNYIKGQPDCERLSCIKTIQVA